MPTPGIGPASPGLNGLDPSDDPTHAAQTSSGSTASRTHSFVMRSSPSGSLRQSHAPARAQLCIDISAGELYESSLFAEGWGPAAEVGSEFNNRSWAVYCQAI